MKEPVDLGIGRKCSACDNQICSCEYRGADGSWNPPKKFEGEKWEYKKFDGHSIEEIQELGRQGWELCGTLVVIGTTSGIIFKRKIKE